MKINKVSKENKRKKQKKVGVHMQLDPHTNKKWGSGPLGPHGIAARVNFGSNFPHLLKIETMGFTTEYIEL
jgi:hypothetical protein